MSYANESVASLDGVKKPLQEKPVIPELTKRYYDLWCVFSDDLLPGGQKRLRHHGRATRVLLSDLSKGSRVVGQVPRANPGYLGLEDTVALSYPAESEAVQQEIGRNLFRLLFSLDEDSDASNGVTMTAGFALRPSRWRIGSIYPVRLRE